MRAATSPSTGTPGRSDRSVELLALAVPIVLGALVRIGPAAGSGFPVGDGGMFYVMAREIDRAGLTLPMTTAYNGAGIPFAYPPLGLWLVAAVGRVLPVSLLDLFHWWPVAWSILTIPAFYLVARRLLGSWFEAVVAATAFALIPRSFEWLVTGGAVTRAPGYVFALLAIHQLILAIDTGGRRNLAGASILAGLAIMSHPNAALLVVLSTVVVGLLRRPGREAVVRVAFVLAGAAMISAAWWVIALARFGPEPLISAVGAGSRVGPVLGIFRVLTFSFTEEPFMPWVAGLGAIGLVWTLARREFLLPVWLVSILLFDATAGPTSAAIPLAVLAGLATARVVPYLVGNRAVGPGPEVLRFGGVRMVLATLVVLAFVGGLVRPTQEGSPDNVVPGDVRSAMAWVASSTVSGATFAVVTGTPWYSDVVGEWFPALADRTSVATVQGHEWLGSADWWRQQDLDAALQGCSTAGADCLTAWMDEFAVHPTYVFLPKGRIAGPMSSADCCGGLREALSGSASYRVAYDGPGASIFRLTAP